MIETPQVVEAPAQLVATLHIETPRSKMQHVMGPGIRAAMAAVQAQGIGPDGPWFAHHLKMTPEPVRLGQGDKWTGPFPFFPGTKRTIHALARPNAGPGNRTIGRHRRRSAQRGRRSWPAPRPLAIPPITKSPG
jgi:hypothetical protein